MNKPDNSSQPTENACIESMSMLRIPPERLRQWLNDHRNRLQKSHFELTQTAGRVKKEIAVIDAMLADLTIG